MKSTLTPPKAGNAMRIELTPPKKVADSSRVKMGQGDIRFRASSSPSKKSITPARGKAD